MKRTFAAGLLSLCVLELHAPAPADACGVKLTVKSSAPRKAVSRSSNPSDVLLLGKPPRRLEADLAAAGHRVDVAPDAASAKSKPYAVVVTDAQHQGEAREKFASSVVLVRSGDVSADMRSVEQQVARKPVRADRGREVVAARPARQPIAAGPVRESPRKIVATKEPTEPAPAPAPAPTPAPAPVPPPERITTKPAPPPAERPAPAARPARPAAPSTLREELYFGYNAAKAGGHSRALARAVRWLNERADAQVVIEGHADPAGTPEGNQWLAQKRAEWVRDQLVAAGIDSSRLEVVSYGDTRLKYGRSDGRNRRVAIVVK